MTGDSFRPLTASLRSSFPGVEFVYADGGYPAGSTRLWVPDPPGGKESATTDPDVAAASMAVLDEIVQNQGPFFGILGYSQGSMFVKAYLSHAPVGTFKVAMMFAGYIPTTHQGLLNSIREASPFNNIPALVWMGGNDFVISNSMTNQQAELFTDPFVIRDPSAGHVVPGSSDVSYNFVVQWLEDYIASNGTRVDNPVLPDDLTDSPSAASKSVTLFTVTALLSFSGLLV